MLHNLEHFFDRALVIICNTLRITLFLPCIIPIVLFCLLGIVGKWLNDLGEDLLAWVKEMPNWARRHVFPCHKTINRIRAVQRARESAGTHQWNRTKRRWERVRQPTAPQAA
jgi:hypothetical protein